MVQRSYVSNVLVGAVNLTGIIYVAEKLVGSGPGGNICSPRFVANIVAATGYIAHHAHYEIEIAFDEDEVAALYTTGYLVPGVAVSALVITEKSSAITPLTRTITYTLIYVMSAPGAKVETQAEHNPFICTFMSIGTHTVSAWA